jgi:hypothetical protein
MYSATRHRSLVVSCPRTRMQSTFAVQAEQVFDASPDLSGLMKDDRADRSTMMTRRFSGGSVTYVSAGAPRNLTSAHRATGADR